mgnify:CR=1 FL=1
MDRRRFLTRLSATGLGALALSGCGPITVVEDPRSPRNRKVEGEVMGAVLYARRAGLLRHHLGPSLRPWATNGTLVVARGPDKGPHDLVLDYAHFVDRALHTYHSPPTEGRMLRFKDPVIRVVGSEAQFTFTTMIIDPTYVLVMRESYELWLSQRGWMVIRARRWPLEERKQGGKFRFDASEWAQRDALAKAANARGDHVQRVRDLLAGWRFKDAFAAAKTATETEGLSSAEAAKRWALRGEVAVQLGLASEAVGAFKQALKLDPKVQLPGVKAADDARVGLGL